MKVALVYDRVNKWGGAERVLLALHKIFPDAPLYTSLYDKKKVKWAKPFDVRVSFLQSASSLRQYNDLLVLFMPIAFESFSFDEFDLVISVTSEAAKGIITKPGTIHICYCLTPTRYLWSGYDDYFSNNTFRTLTNPSVSYLRKWDQVASSRPDYYIAISTEVKKRIKEYYKRESEIIFPPLTLEKYKKISKKTKQDYFLLVSRFSRFTYYKKVDLAIEAFNITGLPLKIIGTGPMIKAYKSKAKNNIEFLGELTDRRLTDYYENCKALVFPGLEDFGLVMAEAQSLGKPVIAYKAGGAKDIIKPGVTGEFFSEQTPESLIKTLKRFNEKSYNKAEIIRNSKKFSYKIFKNELEAFIKEKI
ncbi:MAG: glycosyltransferase [Patescibacteria group bacterium]|mgnify:FL=1